MPAVRVYSARALARFASADDGSEELEDAAFILSTYRKSLQSDQNAVSIFMPVGCLQVGITFAYKVSTFLSYHSYEAYEEEYFFCFQCLIYFSFAIFCFLANIIDAYFVLFCLFMLFHPIL